MAVAIMGKRRNEVHAGLKRTTGEGNQLTFEDCQTFGSNRL